VFDSGLLAYPYPLDFVCGVAYLLTMLSGLVD
jgi:hypothetical protein